jgi:hypothetical protein
MQALTSKYERPQLMTVDQYKALSPADRLEYNLVRTRHISGGIRVPTPVRDETIKLYRNIRWANCYAPNRTGLIIDAEGHMGKTTLAVDLMEWTLKKFRAEFPTFERDGYIPIVYVEAPPRSTGKALMAQFAKFFGVPRHNKDTTDSTVDLVVNLMRKARVQMVVIDEFHNIADKNIGNGETVDYLKRLTNLVGATFVLAGIGVTSSPVLEGARGNQLRSRFTNQVLPRYSAGDDASYERWQQVLLSFERELTLLAQKPRQIQKLSSQLLEKTNGSIGALHKLLTRTAIELIWNDEPETEQLTAKVIAGQRLDITSESVQSVVTPAKRKAPRRVAA